MLHDQARYWTVKDELTVNKDGIIMLGKRQVIASPLRKEVCRIAHASHQGKNSMLKMCK